MTTTQKIVKTKPCTVKGCPGRTEDLPNFPLIFCGACALPNDNTMLLGCCGAKVWQELANGELRTHDGFICDVCAAKQSRAAKQSQEYTTAYGNGVAAVMPSTKDAVAALTGRIAVAEPVVNSKHPELLLGEMFLTNATPETFEEIGWKTKRLGRVAYGVDGKRVHNANNLFPVFVAKSELPMILGGTADAPDEKPNEEKPVPSIQPYDGMRVSVNGKKGTVRENTVDGRTHPVLPWKIVWDEWKRSGTSTCPDLPVEAAAFNDRLHVSVEPVVVHLFTQSGTTPCGLDTVAQNQDEPALWTAGASFFVPPTIPHGLLRCPACWPAHAGHVAQNAVAVPTSKPNDYQKDRKRKFHGKDCPVRQRRDFLQALTLEQRQFLKPADGRWKAECNCDHRRIEWIPTGTAGLRIAFNGDRVFSFPFTPKKPPELPLSDLDEDFQG